MSEYYLTRHIVSHTTQKVYGRKGDVVFLISARSEHINTVIAELAGNRFPVPVNALSDTKIDADEIQIKSA